MRSHEFFAWARDRLKQRLSCPKEDGIKYCIPQYFKQVCWNCFEGKKDTTKEKERRWKPYSDWE